MIDAIIVFSVTDHIFLEISLVFVEYQNWLACQNHESLILVIN